MKNFLVPIILALVVYLVRQWYRGPTIVTRRDQLYPNLTYDYVVIGAGTAGCVVAARLTEMPNVSVLVLEAGYDDYDFPYTQWMAMEQNLQRTDFDWHYKTVPQKSCCGSSVNRESKWPRGKGLGGCSSHNGAAHVRGSRFDYDHWDNLLGPDSGWSFKDVLPYFKKSENAKNVERLRAKTELHGFDGPITLTDSGLSPLAAVVVEAAKSLGFPWRDDINLMGAHEDQTGFSSVQRALYKGRRISSAEAYLRPAARARPDRLHILTKAHVTRLIIDDPDPEFLPIVNAVEFVHEGVTMRVNVTRETILSAGTINSPQILMLSGIGDKLELEKFGIKTVVDNEAVGRNLYDHVWVPLSGTINDSTVSYNGVDPADWFDFFKAEMSYYLFGSGPLAGSGIEFSSFIRSGRMIDEAWPDLQIYLIGSAIATPFDVFNLDEKAVEALYPSTEEPGRKRMGLLPILLHPHNSGEIRLKSADPFEHPIIDPRYLDNQYDVDILVEGMKICLKLFNSPHVKRYDMRLSGKHAPGCEHLKLWSDEYLKCHVRSMLLTVYHPVGTCRMGKDNSVVDTKLRVHGVDKLRIVDASIFPFQVSANTNAPVLMVAEKASDIIKKAHADRDAGLPAAPQEDADILLEGETELEEYRNEEGQCYEENGAEPEYEYEHPILTLMRGD